jgi:hypothetical protein
VRDLLLTGLQLATSIARLAAFAFSVLTIGRLAVDPRILFIIGYLPFLAFFDVLIQSGSRAAHLRGAAPSDAVAGLRRAYALAALALIAAMFAASLSYPIMSRPLLLVAWPLGALGFMWERWIAQRNRQWLLSGAELLLLGAVVGLYAAGLSWRVLLLAIISFPIARLATLALPASARGAPDAPPMGAPTAAPLGSGRAWVGKYIGASLAQQLVAAAASSLPAIYAQITGDQSRLSVNIALFRSLHSFAAVLSLTINAMSSRIFYRQTGAGFESLERTVLDRSALIGRVAIGLGLVAAGFALAAPDAPIAFGLAILPILAMVNALSSMLYNRGLPLGTLHCQILVLFLSTGLLAILLGQAWPGVLALVASAIYASAALPSVLRSHRARLGLAA